MTATTIHRRADDLLCPFGMMDVCVLFTRTHFPVPPVDLFAFLDNREKQIVRTVKNF